jgi:hypothetical protein
MKIFNRGPGFWDGSRSSIGKVEAARRGGYIPGPFSSGSLENSGRRVGFHSRPKNSKPEQPKEIGLPIKTINIQGL